MKNLTPEEMEKFIEHAEFHIIGNRTRIDQTAVFTTKKIVSALKHLEPGKLVKFTDVKDDFDPEEVGLIMECAEVARMMGDLRPDVFIEMCCSIADVHRKGERN